MFRRNKVIGIRTNKLRCAHCHNAYKCKMFYATERGQFYTDCDECRSIVMMNAEYSAAPTPVETHIIGKMEELANRFDYAIESIRSKVDGMKPRRKKR